MLVAVNKILTAGRVEQAPQGAAPVQVGGGGGVDAVAHTLEHAVASVIAVDAGVLVAGLMVDGREAPVRHGARCDCCVLPARTARPGFTAAVGGSCRESLNAFDAVVILASALPLARWSTYLLRLARLRSPGPFRAARRAPAGRCRCWPGRGPHRSH